MRQKGEKNTNNNHPALENNQLSFRDAMWNANPYLTILFDDSLNIVDCNPAAVTYFGFSSRQELLEHLLPLIVASVPEYQPDGSPSVPLQTRFEYVIQNGEIEFELEMVLQERRVPMLFTLKKVPMNSSFAKIQLSRCLLF